MPKNAENIISVMAETLGVPADSLVDRASFTKDLGIDSLDVFELVDVLEKEFNVSIPEEEAEKLSTVGLLVNYLLAHVNTNKVQ